MKAGGVSDKRVLLWLGGGTLLLILAVSILAPKAPEEDPRPTTYNSSSAGARAAYLLLQELGYKAERWNLPAGDLQQVDAEHVTLVMAEPYVPPKRLKETTASLQSFLERGGRVLLTGGPLLVSHESVKASASLDNGLCYTTPEGQGALAQAGQVAMTKFAAWDEAGSKLGVALHVEQRCGDDAVVVRYAVGKGEVIWWSSPMPLSNAGLKDDGSLRLLLASVGGTDRRVLFDEFVHGPQVGFWDAAKGLPLKWLLAQFALIAVLLVVSFGRRNGPLRRPVTVPRTSPVEFAESMGHLYERAGATNAATGMARRRLLRCLEAEVGLPHATMEQGPSAIAEALAERLGGDWSALRQRLVDAAEAEHAELAAKSALRLVQALNEDVERLHAVLSPGRVAAAPVVAVNEEESAELLAATRG